MTAIIGTAGWSIAKNNARSFPAGRSALERYAQVFGGVEVNSSFHRPHRASTWAKWEASVPENFRFAVKIPKTITHEAKLRDVDGLIEHFAEEIAPLGAKLAVLLVQLPPKLSLDAASAERCFTTLRTLVGAGLVCEPRNPTWFNDEADAMLNELRVARVAADPALGPAAAVPGGWPGLAYWRLHGSPAMYRSSYDDERIQHYAHQIQAAIETGANAWCMFDNTAASAATGNALSLTAKLAQDGRDAGGSDYRNSRLNLDAFGRLSGNDAGP